MTLNSARVILDNLPQEIAELESERKEAISKVYDLDLQIAHLKTQYEFCLLSNPDARPPVAEIVNNETDSRRSA